ncbi:hypothetical protein QWY90_11600 [Flavobacterium paronense]|uniref:DUF4468 domain-containing protein n=1 Tax=Flavobacterium paronense TaxID=1392775 RepID=A0ABV5GDE2_9FLAO|nr:hypothetical protein [Flavobacterium paronense]MDN3677953.1 hypothetical protein [Flavobacterium paronense]
MKKIFFSLLVMSCFAFNDGDTKMQTYSYGHNGMEFVAREGKGMIIVSTYNSKMTIRQDIAYKIYQLYANDRLTSGPKTTICGDEADVTGKCIIRKKDNLISLDFYYELVEWKSGLKEMYKKKTK